MVPDAVPSKPSTVTAAPGSKTAPKTAGWMVRSVEVVGGTLSPKLGLQDLILSFDPASLISDVPCLRLGWTQFPLCNRLCQPYMNAQEFQALITEKTDEQLLQMCLYDEITPYVFESRPLAWKTFRENICAQLGVSQNEIRIVGSGRFGFSMKPWKGLAGFGDTSDIDVLIVNSNAFDELWLSLLTAAYPRPPMTEKVGGWLRDRRNEVYTGWISPLEIYLDVRIFGEKARKVLDYKMQWFNAFKQASRVVPRRHEDVNGRLYRTWSHAELYHLNSLDALRKSLIS